MDERSRLEAAIAAQEGLRATLGDELVDTAITALRRQLDQMSSAPQRKLVTVLFADVSGFTAWGEKTDAEDVAEAIDSLWQRFDRIILEHNGKVDKHLGDAVMAVWGAGAAGEDDAENAIRAALEMQASFSAAASDELSASELSLRIGINTGPVMLREIGSAGEYTAIGDAVNVAARLEAAGPTGLVLIGHETYRHVRGVFTTTEQPPLEVKGKRETLRTYLVSGVRPRAFRLENRGIEGVETRMVGRDADLDTLRGLLADATAEEATRAATIVGEAGMGKSRLLYEFLDWLQLQPEDFFLLSARTDALRATTPYALVKDLLFFRFEIGLDDPVDEVMAKLVDGFESFAGLGEAEAVLAAHLIGFDMRARPPVSGLASDPQLLRDRAEDAVRSFLVGMAASLPVVLLLEDLHWADRSSLHLLKSIGETGSGPLLMVATTRPVLFDADAAWSVLGTRIDLDSLPPAAIEAQVRDALRYVEVFPVGFLESIVDAAGGNPFYVEELIKSSIEAGRIRVSEEVWEIDPDNAVMSGTPPTLTALLQARLDRLSSSELATLQPASVVGRVFWDEAVRSAAGERGEVDLSSLVKRDLIGRRRESAVRGAVEYRFNHSLLRDVTYETVLLQDRRRFHRAVAEWLIARVDQSAWAAVIAGHYEVAEPAEAAVWHVRAGVQARQRFANDQALKAFGRALDLGGLDDENLFAALDGLGEVLTLQARYAEAAATHREMLEAARATGDRRAEAKAMTGIIFAEARTGSTSDLSGFAEETVALVRAFPEPDPQLLCEALRGAGWIALTAGELDAALQSATEAVAAAETAGDRRGLSLSLVLLSLTESSLGHLASAESKMEQALALGRGLGNRRDEGTTLLNLGELARLRGAYEIAAGRYGEALEISRDLGDRDNEALALSNLGGAYVGIGRHEEAIGILGSALEAFEATGRRDYLSESKRFLAEAHLGLGDTENAGQWAGGALSDGRAAGSRDQVGQAYRVLGNVAAFVGHSVDVDEGSLTAEECFARAVAQFAQSELDRALTMLDWARYIHRKDPAGAQEMWADAVTTLRRLDLAGLAGELA